MSTVTISKEIKLPTIKQIIANTSFKKKKTAMAVIETLKWLAAGAPHDNFNGFDTPIYFNMNNYILLGVNEYGQRANYDEVSACGTSCCMAGAIQLFRKHKIPKKSQGSYELDSAFGSSIMYRGDEDLNKLFYGKMRATAAEAFDALYGYCTTGEVVWK